MKKIIVLTVIFCISCLTQAQTGQYNILFLVVDDLNDWVGFLDGNPQTITPNMDRLASESIIFENTYCNVSLCNPSRAALMTGVSAATSGLTGNDTFFRDIPMLKNILTLPQYMSKNGNYSTMARGKIFHRSSGLFADLKSWDRLVLEKGTYGIVSNTNGYMANGMPIGTVTRNFDWAGSSARFEESTDYLNAKWAANQLKKTYYDPFFLACGIYRPHLPWVVPKEFMEKFALENIKLPIMLEDDLADTPIKKASRDFKGVKAFGKMKEPVRAYLASINYADACLGVVLEELYKSEYNDNTIIVLLGDHGFHLGEKLRFKKNTLWEEASRTPLLIRIPKSKNGGQRIKAQVNLIDIYPTILDLVGLAPNTNNDGQSLVPLINNPSIGWNPYSITHTAKGSTIRSEQYRFINNDIGRNEFYDHAVDSLEHFNLVGDVNYADQIRLMEDKLDSALFLKKSFIKTAVRESFIPGVIQAEKFDRGGEGVSYHDADSVNSGGLYRTYEGVDLAACYDVGGGLKITDSKNGEWLTYSIKEVVGGIYNINFRVLSYSLTEGVIDLYLENKLLGRLLVPSRRDCTKWVSLSLQNVTLPTSSFSELKYQVVKGDFDVNFIEFVLTVPKTPVLSSDIIVYPNPVHGNICVKDERIIGGLYTLFSLNGIKWGSGKIENDLHIDVATVPKGVYVLKIVNKGKVFIKKVIVE